MARKKQRRPGVRATSLADRQIGARIRARRLELHMAQAELAHAIGVTFQQVQKYEKGVNRVAAATLMRIADALEIDLRALLPDVRDTGGQLESPEVMQAARTVARLNAEGRRVALGLLRSLAADEKMRR